MSKAFTREEDNAPEERPLRPRVQLPFGVKNYITREGHAKFRADLAQCEIKRSEILQKSGPTSPDLPKIDEHIRYYQEILATAEIAPLNPDKTKIRFGDRVKVRYQSGELETFQIVGIDETDIETNLISWISPLAKALLGKSINQTTQFHTPAGPQTLTILEIS